MFAPGSAASEDDVREAVAHGGADTFGTLTTLINNAAATHLTGPGRTDTNVVDTPTAVFDEVVRTGLYGTFWSAKYAIPHMIEAGGGAIINISAASSVLSI